MSFIEFIPVSFTLKERFFACRFLSWVSGSEAGLLTEGDIVDKIGCSSVTYRKLRAQLIEHNLVTRTKRLLGGQVVYKYEIVYLPKKTSMSNYRQKVSETVLFDAGSNDSLKQLNHSSLCVFMYLVSLADDLGMLPIWATDKYLRLLGIGEASFFSHLQKIKSAGLLSSYKGKRGYTVLSKALAIREVNLKSISSDPLSSTAKLYVVDFVYPGKLFGFIRSLRILHRMQKDDQKLSWGPKEFESTQIDDDFLTLGSVDWPVYLSMLPNELSLIKKFRRTKEEAAELLERNASLVWLLSCDSGGTGRQYEAYFNRCYGRLASLYLSMLEQDRDDNDLMIAIACHIFQLRDADSVYAFAESYIDALEAGDRLIPSDRLVELDLEGLPQVSKAIAVMLVDFVRLDIKRSEQQGARFKQRYSGFQLISYSGTYVAIAEPDD